MPYSLGDLIKQHLSRRHGVNQTRLAEGVNVDAAVITRICKGTRPPGRDLLIRIIQWMHHHDILANRDEANALLAAAGLADFRPDIPAETALLLRLPEGISVQQEITALVAPPLSLMSSLPTPVEMELAAWGAACEDCIRSGDLGRLDLLLDQPLPPCGETYVIFYRGRLAALRAEYALAERHFHAAAAAARTRVQSDLHHRSLVWIAYCHNLLGNYRLARTLAERVASIVPVDNPIYAEVFFVCGLIAADGGSLLEAYELLEQARDLALLLPHRYLEARCCANLAPICNSLGRLDRAGYMIRRVEQLGAGGEASPQQLWQARNTNVHRLRFMGELDEALRVALPLPEIADDGSRHFRGWLALSTATVAIDADRFDLAEQAWQRACELLEGIEDNNLSKAELLWERAWLRFRQDQLNEAHADIQAALRLIEAGIDTEHAHALTIAAIIDLARDDLALVGRHFREASDRFRMAKHQMGLASVLLHIATYHLRSQRPVMARATLAEALTLLRRYRFYGVHYWLPATMAPLCYIAMAEDWGDESRTLAIRPLEIDEHQAPADIYELDSHPRDILGDFAAQLAAHRLAAGYWRVFAPLLEDRRPQVRRRAAQVLLASPDPEARACLELLQADSDPEIREWLMKHGQ